MVILRLKALGVGPYLVLPLHFLQNTEGMGREGDGKGREEKGRGGKGEEKEKGIMRNISTIPTLTT